VDDKVKWLKALRLWLDQRRYVCFTEVTVQATDSPKRWVHHSPDVPEWAIGPDARRHYSPYKLHDVRPTVLIWVRTVEAEDA
jgi:hypothetical protein